MDGFQVPNPVYRFAIGDRDVLKFKIADWPIVLMKAKFLQVLTLYFAVLFASVGHAASDIFLPDLIQSPEAVSINTLESKIKETESDIELEETTKNRLLEYYRSSIRNLEELRSNQAASEELRRSRKTYPKLTAQIKYKLDERKTRSPSATVSRFTEHTPLTEMERGLLAEKANLAAVKAKLSDLERQLALSAARPDVLQRFLIEANRKQEEITARLLQGEAESQPPLLAKAFRWMLETKLSALRSEITRLDQELLNLPLRIEYLESAVAWYEIAVQELSKLVTAIQEIVNRKQQVEAEKAKAKAENAKRDLEGKPALIQHLANENTALTDQLSRLANDLDQTVRATEASRAQDEQIEKEFQNIRKKLEIGGFARALGRVLIELHRQLPNRETFSKRTALREQRVAEIGLQQLQYSEEYQAISDLPLILDKLASRLSDQEAKENRGELKRLVATRKDLLDQLNRLSTSYLRALSDYEFVDRKLDETVQDYEKFLSENLIWIRSSPLPSADALNKIPAKLDWLLSSSHWLDVAKALQNQASRSPILVLGLFLVGFMFWKSKSLRVSLKETGTNVGKISKDAISLTFYALFLTMLLAASWPLLFAILGWQLKLSPEATPFTNVISEILVRISVSYFSVRVFKVICEPDGLAIAHFRMPTAYAKRLHREVGRFIAVLLPAQFLFMLAYGYDLVVGTGEIGRILLAIILIEVTYFLYRIIPSKRMLFDGTSNSTREGLILSKLVVLRFVLISISFVLLALNFIGYIFTVGILTQKLVYTLIFAAGLYVIEKIAVRWLLLTQRRLAWKAALEKREAAKTKRDAGSAGDTEFESETGEIEEPEIDFKALSTESLYLLNMSLALIGIAGLLAIWAEILPAFSLLSEITLWSHTEMVGDEIQTLPVTLLDFALALLIAFVTFVAAKYLPSLLEIIMLQRTSMTTGSRYTVTTITNYVIVALGTILFFNTMGADWSKLQWLVAALGVGIGFGLQEIVANFISGLIILFERPIRVGDIVTIGGQDGTVVRIRIRATTIRNWDRQELLVPNKEFITGQLVNWTLSEETTRVVIPVGLAYGGDVEQAMKIMMDAAEKHPQVLRDPGPSVVFDEFGDNALSLKLRCFVGDIDHRVSTITALHKEINRRFNEAGLVIAYPQRDIHLDTNAPLDVFVRQEERPSELAR